MNKLVDIARDLQALAQAGLYYGKDKYDIERFEKIRDLSAHLLSYALQKDFEEVKKFFCADSGYQTPKIEVRSAVFKENKILLVQEDDGRWAMPGGWADIQYSLLENAVKEIEEEAGVQAEIDFVVALQDRNRHFEEKSTFPLYTVLLKGHHLSGAYKENLETLDSRYFSLEEIPILWEGKTSMEQIKLCFEANESLQPWKTILE